MVGVSESDSSGGVDAESDRREANESNTESKVNRANEANDVDETDGTTGEPSDGDSGVDTDKVVATLKWGAVFTFGILAAVALAGLYTSLGSIIDVWVAHEYQPFTRAGVNLAVLAAAVAGIVTIIRRT